MLVDDVLDELVDVDVEEDVEVDVANCSKSLFQTAVVPEVDV